MRQRPFYRQLFLALAALLFAFATAAPAQAASQAECAIWLCLPGGFGPAACGPAHAAMLKRLEHFDPPLPPFSECSADHSDNGLSYTMGTAAHIPKQQICSISGVLFGRSRSFDDGPCGTPVTIQDQYVNGSFCNDQGRAWLTGAGEYAQRPSAPGYCDSSYKSITLYQNGSQLGPTFYWDRYVPVSFQGGS